MSKPAEIELAILKKTALFLCDLNAPEDDVLSFMDGLKKDMDSLICCVMEEPE